MRNLILIMASLFILSISGTSVLAEEVEEVTEENIEEVAEEEAVVEGKKRKKDNKENAV